MEIRLLGPVDLGVGGRIRDAGPPQRRTVLAVLAATPGVHVAVDLLVDRVWGETPPPHARRALHAHLSRLRGLLGEASSGESRRPVLVRRCGGYLLDVPPSAVDLHRFRQLVDLARAPGAGFQRLELLRSALRLQRGIPLAGLTGEWARMTREAWQREHLDAVCCWAEAEVAAGNHSAVIRHLGELVVAHPLVEPLAAMLIRALDASGFTSDALDRYAETSARLVTELGIEPSEELRALHRELLGGCLGTRVR